MAAVGTAARSSRPTRIAGYPAGSTLFDLEAALLGVMFVVGLFIDGYAHNHGMVDESFFTPFHAVMYGSIALSGVFFGIHQLRNTLKGYSFAKALPRGYRLSLMGVILFLMGGGFDMWWHYTFGFEVSTEALLSPAHLFLATGGFLIVTGAIRSAAVRLQSHTPHTWGQVFPLVLALTGLLAMLSFFLMFSNLFAQAPSLIGELTRRPNGTLVAAVVSGFLVTAALNVGAAFVGMKLARLPFGAITFMLTLSAAGMMWLDWDDRNQPLLLIAPLLAGLIVDTLSRMRLSDEVRARLIGFALPFVMTGGVFVILLLTSSLWLSIHLWLGITFMTGIAGVFLSYLVVPHVGRE